MRRPRSKLEVSTFPFLAVLLCAMGSLLLLLFIMDRRAKVAAQNNARESIETRKKRTQEEEDTRQAEWEKAKQQLHLTLMQQHDQLLTEANGVQDKLADIGFDGELHIMQCHGGMVPLRIGADRPIFTIGSGPVGGLIGCARVCKELGTGDVIASDMGGTSLDPG